MVQAVIPTTVVGLQGRPVASTPAPTNNQALIWNGSAWVPGGPYLTAAGAPYIATNYVDNSGFSVGQRPNITSGVVLAAGAYGWDRWKAGASGCTLTWTFSPASTVITIAAGTLQQVIEGGALINASYTLSWLGSATGRVNTGAYVASPITFTGAPNTNVTIEFQGGTLGQVQLQIGSQATLWQPSPPALELARCQRFFNTNFFNEASYGAGVWTVNIFLPVSMRATPTVTLSNVQTANLTSFGVQNAASNAIVLSGSNPAAGYTGANGNYAASADL